MVKKLLSFSFLLVSLTFQAQNLISEGFDTYTNLATAGWTSTNQSAVIGTNPSWFQGNPFASGGPFDSYAGATILMLHVISIVLPEPIRLVIG